MKRQLVSAILAYPSHLPEPVDLLHFIELKPFTRAWSSMKLGDDSLAGVQAEIMANPKLFPVVKGTGGLRKMRFSPDDWQTGKSGALRICYVYFEEFHIVTLNLVYPKTERLDLTSEEKKVVSEFIDRQRIAFSKGSYN
ncbi:hypothetical protein SH661x_001046 [Planctomicrobium sp. SH661]|uniref:hypothetical protein n=1 Tax=Planctomicrobium sp. SH661 TaxID=3448124 RepID=UPI003F5B80F7